jgi:hypothetical protein
MFADFKTAIFLIRRREYSFAMHTRAYGELSGKGVTIFEMDQTAVQQHKQQGLAAAGIACEHVQFAPVDFSRDDAFTAHFECWIRPYEEDARRLCRE